MHSIFSSFFPLNVLIKLCVETNYELDSSPGVNREKDCKMRSGHFINIIFMVIITFGDQRRTIYTPEATTDPSSFLPSHVAV